MSPTSAVVIHGVILSVMMMMCGCSSAKSDVELSEKNPVIVLERTECFGKCPAYKLMLLGNGIATYDGLANVNKMGFHKAKISREALIFLIKEFKQTDFFAMKDIYDAMVTDVPTYTVRFTLNDSTKIVFDRFDPPWQLRALERTIDSVAATLDWERINE